MPSESLNIRDETNPKIRVEYKLWFDRETGDAICMLTPTNQESFMWIAKNREAIRGGFEETHNINRESQFFEAQFYDHEPDGRYQIQRRDGAFIDVSHSYSAQDIVDRGTALVDREHARNINLDRKMFDR